MILQCLLFISGVFGVDKCDQGCEECHLVDYKVSGCDGIEACKEGWHCLRCKGGTQLWFDKCLAPCPVGQFRQGYECQNCAVNCSQCTGPDEHECAVCDSTHEFDYRHLCVMKCQSDQYPEFVRNVGSSRCLSCNVKCRTCIGPWTSSCTTCSEGDQHRIRNIATNTGECMGYCVAGYYRDSSGDRRCTQCSHNCIKCESSDKCSRCAEGYYLYPVQKTVLGYREYLHRACAGRDELGFRSSEEVRTVKECGTVCDATEKCRAFEWTPSQKLPCALSTSCDLTHSQKTNNTDLFLKGGPKVFSFTYCYAAIVKKEVTITVANYLGLTEEELAAQQAAG
eukprot:GEMP01041536.1.p1 GENE.GEMP01041536.1~~GEMP01041536.1.p1  ORF type:complete len:338 (+),score=57.77 GEMP01041536.1:119-1132(+)